MNQKDVYVLRSGEKSSSEFTVRRVLPLLAYRYVGAISLTMSEAYKRQFEGAQTGLLPKGSAEQHFKPRDVEHQGAERLPRMRHYINKQGSSYWVALKGRSRYYDEPAESILGVVKASPSRPGLRKLGKLVTAIDRPNCYINDLEVREADEGICSALLLVALKDYALGRTVVADVLPGGEEFFAQYGFIPGEQQDDLEIGDGSLSVTRFEAAKNREVQGLIIKKFPWVNNPVNT